MADVKHPKMLGQVQTTGKVESAKEYGGWGHRVLVSGDKAYMLADQFGSIVGGIHIVDVSDPANLKKIGYFSAKGYAKGEGKQPRRWARGLALDGSTLFVTDCSAGVICLDVSTPANMKLIELLEVPDARGRNAVRAALVQRWRCDRIPASKARFGPSRGILMATQETVTLPPPKS